MRTDLVRQAKRLKSGKLADREAVQKMLRHWQWDVDLFGLRDPATVARLPADQREACRILWSDVEALLKKAI